MKIHTLTRKGFDHITFCEDFVVTHELENFLVGAVFDGCSGGGESHFASALFGKSIKAQLINFEGISLEMYSTETLSKDLIYGTIPYLNNIKNVFKLSNNELLTTILLFVFDKRNKSVNFVCVGDGVIAVKNNNDYTIPINISQNNKPRYITYFLDPTEDVNEENLNISNLSDFSKWWEKEPYKLYLESVSDFTIATDGINTFKNSKNDIDYDPIKFLTEDLKFVKNEVMLPRKYNILKNNGWSNMDDIGMVRMIVEK